MEMFPRASLAQVIAAALPGTLPCPGDRGDQKRPERGRRAPRAPAAPLLATAAPVPFACTAVEISQAHRSVPRPPHGRPVSSRSLPPQTFLANAALPEGCGRGPRGANLRVRHGHSSQTAAVGPVQKRHSQRVGVLVFFSPLEKKNQKTFTRRLFLTISLKLS